MLRFALAARRHTKSPHPTASLGLANDISETTGVSSQNPTTVKHLQAEAEKARHELDDALAKRTGIGIREPGHVERSP